MAKAKAKAKAKGKAVKWRSDAELLAELGILDDRTNARAAKELTTWFAAHPEEVMARATRFAELALTKEYAGRSRLKAGCAILPVLIDGLKDGESLPAKWDPLVTAFGELKHHLRVLGTIPVERRTKIFEREIGSGDYFAILRIADALLDLAPEALSVMLDHHWARGELREKLSSPHLTKWRKKVPRIDEILNDYAERASKAALPPPPKPKPGGTLSFAFPLAIYPSDFPMLDEVVKKQYCLAAEQYAGAKVRNAKHFVELLEEKEMNAGDAEMRRWRVFRGGKHGYELWVVWVDNSVVFEADSVRRVPVLQIQDNFQASDGSPEWKALAEELEKSKPDDLWSVPLFQ